MKRRITIALIVAAALVVSGALFLAFAPYGCLAGMRPSPKSDNPPLADINMPDGFKIDIYARVPNARGLELSPEGTLFVGNRSGDKVYAVLDNDGDKKADEVLVIDEGLRMPNGVDTRDGSLFVAEVSRVLRYDNIEKRLHQPPGPVVVSDAFPSDEHHGWKFMKFGPDGKLYVPVGAPCNLCDEKDPRFASIMRMDPDGSDLEVFASGIRNTVGFDWHPDTGVLWFTDNGRDWMGDNRPPDELNRAPKPDMHFGFPYCHGEDISDPEFGGGKECEDYTPPALELGPHVAALGMRFYTGDMFPEKYRGGIFIAEHGSWNRTVPIGYRVMFVTVKDGKALEKEVFADGWLGGTSAWGRPVDVEIMDDGSLLVSDDKAGLVYRISYSG